MSRRLSNAVMAAQAALNVAAAVAEMIPEKPAAAKKKAKAKKRAKRA